MKKWKNCIVKVCSKNLGFPDLPCRIWCRGEKKEKPRGDDDEASWDVIEEDVAPPLVSKLSEILEKILCKELGGEKSPLIQVQRQRIQFQGWPHQALIWLSKWFLESNFQFYWQKAGEVILVGSIQISFLMINQFDAMMIMKMKSGMILISMI